MSVLSKIFVTSVCTFNGRNCVSGFECHCQRGYIFYTCKMLNDAMKVDIYFVGILVVVIKSKVLMPWPDHLPRNSFSILSVIHIT